MHEPTSSRGHAARVVAVLVIALAVAPLCVAALRERALRGASGPAPRLVTLERPSLPCSCSDMAGTWSDYARSVCSFRAETQDAAAHPSEADLLWTTSGNLHLIPHGRQPTRAAPVAAARLGAITAPPESGWTTSSFEAKAGSTWVLQLDDGEAARCIKLRINRVTERKLDLEWLPLDVTAPAGSCAPSPCGGSSISP